MDDELTITQVPASYLEQVEAWFGQEATDRLLKLPGGGFSPGEADAYGWVALLGEEPVAVATLGFNNEHVGHLNFVVKPSHRRHGIGGQLVQHVLALPDIAQLTKLHVLVDMDNTAAQKILSRSGFSSIGHAPDGRQVFEKH